MTFLSTSFTGLNVNVKTVCKVTMSFILASILHAVTALFSLTFSLSPLYMSVLGTVLIFFFFFPKKDLPLREILFFLI